MTLEEIKVATEEQIEEFRSALAGEIESAETQERLDEIDALMNEIEARKLQLVEERKADLQAVAAGEGKTIKEKEERTENVMTLKEIRSSAEYVHAFADYVKTGDEAEVRKLLSENVTGGQIPVPTLVEGRVKTAWERDGIMSRVKKSYLKGNLKIGFEVSATGAAVHTEGDETAPAEEQLVIGVVNLTPASIKKWIRISDEVYDMTDEAFLDYIYDELSYRIALKASEELIRMIDEAPATTSASAVGVRAVDGAPAMGLIAQAISNLSGEVGTPVVIMNRQTWGAFKAAQYQGNFAADPFEGLEVVFTDALPAYATAEADATYAIVGDLQGAQANFPNGDEIKFKFDDLSEAEHDLIKIVGRQFVGLGLVQPYAFCKITK